MTELEEWARHWQLVYDRAMAKGATPNQAITVADANTERSLGPKPAEPETNRSHRHCWTGDRYEHVCQEPSGRACIEPGCTEPAGTSWGPHWCPEHDVERLDRISASLADIAASLEGR